MEKLKTKTLIWTRKRYRSVRVSINLKLSDFQEFFNENLYPRELSYEVKRVSKSNIYAADWSILIFLHEINQKAIQHHLIYNFTLDLYFLLEDTLASIFEQEVIRSRWQFCNFFILLNFALLLQDESIRKHNVQHFNIKIFFI